MTDLRTTLADLVSTLCDPYEHAETYTLRSAIPDGRDPQTIRVHRTRHPSLIDQLAAASEPSRGAGQARGYESSPSARLDAIDILAAIRFSMHAYVAGPDIHRGLRLAVGADWLDEDDRQHLIRDLRSWITWARICTGWDTPPIRPRGRCPHCDVNGSIRVRVEPVTALCVECRSTWSEEDGTIGILAEHIRWCNGELEEVAA